MAKEKKLGFWMLTALTSGNMIGAGIFLLPASLASIGSISLISWALTAVGAFMLSLVYSKLCLMQPKTGGPYAYVESGLGRFMGFQTAYLYWLVTWIGNAGFVVAAIAYLTVFFPILTQPLWGCVTAIAIVWVFTYISIRGAHSVGVVQLLTTILKLVPVILIAVLGWHYFHPSYVVKGFNVSGHSHFSALSQAAIITMWTFVGLESATVPADSVDNPRRNIPLATVCGTVIAAVVYIASASAIMGMIPADVLAHSNSPFAAAAEVIFGHWGKWLIALGAVISCLGCLNGWIMLQGQVPMAAADDHLFPALFSKRNRAGAPAVGLVISGILISVFLILVSGLKSLVSQFNFIILIATFGYLVTYLYSVFAEIVLLKKGSRFVRTHLLIAILAAIYSIWAIFGSGKTIVYYGCMMIFSGFPFYAWMAWKQRNKNLIDVENELVPQ